MSTETKAADRFRVLAHLALGPRKWKVRDTDEGRDCSFHAERDDAQTIAAQLNAIRDQVLAEVWQKLDDEILTQQEAVHHASMAHTGEVEGHEAACEALEGFRAALTDEKPSSGAVTQKDIDRGMELDDEHGWSDALERCERCGGTGAVTVTETGREPDGTPYPYPALGRCPNCAGRGVEIDDPEELDAALGHPSPTPGREEQPG